MSALQTGKGAGIVTAGRSMCLLESSVVGSCARHILIMGGEPGVERPGEKVARPAAGRGEAGLSQGRAPQMSAIRGPLRIGSVPNTVPETVPVVEENFRHNRWEGRILPPVDHI